MNEYIYLDIRGETASFKIPQIYQGVLMSLPLPPFSTILGIISRMIGREITLKDTNIAFRYTYEGNGQDKERYHRWKRNESGTYSYDKTAVRIREIHYKPRLKVVLDNIELFDGLFHPKQVITLGRSQDIAFVNKLKLVKGTSRTSGIIQNTFILFSEINTENLISGTLFNFPESYDYKEGMVRVPTNIQRFFAIGNNNREVILPNLLEIDNEIFYLYKSRI